MSITPEEIVSKNFTITKFRDGYDVAEVDEFLDLVAQSMREMSGNAAVQQPLIGAFNPEPDTNPVPRITATVSESEEKDTLRLLTMAQEIYARLIADGEAEKEAMVEQVKIAHQELFASLESERDELNESIEKLRKYEAEYRARLSETVTQQLRLLEQPVQV